VDESTLERYKKIYSTCEPPFYLDTLPKKEVQIYVSQQMDRVLVPHPVEATITPKTFIVQTLPTDFNKLSQLDLQNYDHILHERIRVFYILGPNPRNPVAQDIDIPVILKYLKISDTFPLIAGGEVVFVDLWRPSRRYPFFDRDVHIDYKFDIEAKELHNHKPSNYIVGDKENLPPNGVLKYYCLANNYPRARHRNLTNNRIVVNLVDKVSEKEFIPPHLRVVTQVIEAPI